MHKESVCPFCLPNDLLKGDILYDDDLWYFVTAEDGELKLGGMIITKRHVTSPFEINETEWFRLHKLLPKFKRLLDKHKPHGFNLGWNINTVGGQNVEHAHLHLFARFEDEPLAGKGIRYVFKQPANKRENQKLKR